MKLVQKMILRVRLALSPKARKRYNDLQEQLERDRILLKATRNWEEKQRVIAEAGATHLVEAGDARLMGDRILMHRECLPPNPKHDFLADTLSSIHVSDLEMTEEEAVWLLRHHSEARNNRRMETLQPSDMVSKDADPWMKFHLR